MIYTKRKRGNPTIAHPAHRGSRIAYYSRISNAEAHVILIYYSPPTNYTCITNPWDIDFALPCE